MPGRRHILTAGAVALAAPAIARAQGASVLKFVPAADLASLDPVWTTSYQSRDHGFLVFDTLYGLDSAFRAHPQMAEGAVTDDGGKTWRITLREGLLFHDGTKVLARDAAASVRRWGTRDGFGQALLAACDEIAAPDDRTLVFRLKAPFPLLPDAPAKTPPSPCPIMPERLAMTDPFRQVTEMVGSGPYRYKAEERVPGALVVYERNGAYRPRTDGTPDGTAGPKIARFDRIEWRIIPDSATAAGVAGQPADRGAAQRVVRRARCGGAAADRAGVAAPGVPGRALYSVGSVFRADRVPGGPDGDHPRQSGVLERTEDVIGEWTNDRSIRRQAVARKLSVRCRAPQDRPVRLARRADLGFEGAGVAE